LLKRNELQNVFQKGLRGEAAIGTGLPGSGLGLAMAKKIVDLFKGTIHVQQSPTPAYVDGSEYHETTFTVRFPIDRY
jgi:signal transduction histidine kinase